MFDFAALVYEMLYHSVFKIPMEEITSAVELFRTYVRKNKVKESSVMTFDEAPNEVLRWVASLGLTKNTCVL